MVCPAIVARMIKADQLILTGHNRCDVAAFVSIAVDTRQRQVVDFRGAAMLRADDVFNLKSEIRVLFGDQTILANMISSSGNNQASFGRDFATHSARNLGRALWPAASDVQAAYSDRVRTFPQR